MKENVLVVDHFHGTEDRVRLICKKDSRLFLTTSFSEAHEELNRIVVGNVRLHKIIVLLTPEYDAGFDLIRRNQKVCGNEFAEGIIEIVRAGVRFKIDEILIFRSFDPRIEQMVGWSPITILGGGSGKSKSLVCMVYPDEEFVIQE